MIIPLDGRFSLSRTGTPHGAASLHLAAGVQFLRQDQVVFEAMLEGWSAQMLGGRGLRRETVASALSKVRSFQGHVNEWPWRWSAAMFDEWMADLASVRQLKVSTRRGYQLAIRAFCSYVCSPHYGWVAECEERFGDHPIQVSHSDNGMQHLSDFEGSPARRPLTRRELQGILDRADAEVSIRLKQGRKGAAMAYRDATMLKVQYGWGLRSNELCHLDTTDLFRSPHAEQFEGVGLIQVRMGKASRGGAPKRRTVATVYQWAVDALLDYLLNVRPLMLKDSSPADAIFVTERGTRMKPRDVANRFAYYRDEMGLDVALTPHSLRHSYVTHLIEDGVDPAFVKEQVGHAYQSTTAIYTGVSTDFKNKMMQDAIRRVLPEPLKKGLS